MEAIWPSWLRCATGSSTSNKFIIAPQALLEITLKSLIAGLDFFSRLRDHGEDVVLWCANGFPVLEICCSRGSEKISSCGVGKEVLNSIGKLSGRGL